MSVDNPPAFPCSEWRNTSSDPLATPREKKHLGLSLRDYFAGQALAGETAAQGDNWASVTALAERSYALADAMLAARQQEK